MKKIILTFIILFLSFQVKSEVSTLNQETLMKQFWRCHSISDETEKSGKSSFPSEYLGICSTTSREVQQRYFLNDFRLMHEWTIKNYKNRPLIVVK